VYDANNYFICKNGDAIDAKQRCDHVTNCSDGDDELECSNYDFVSLTTIKIIVYFFN
jgi:hypothetical protein